ncbi:DoxX family protein (plasmid) [Halorussus salilacus]|uniref:DoxX family protein n=1 Tax=Halorussus salilacus TaxID=2953750 RepID=UPI00209EC6D3|nr:DoxX family protein [Halorussus salilacus]USZ69713.1 DoxX family protein [Halorussus salilacus]
MSRRELDANVLESTVLGRTVRTRAHSLSVWFVLALRLMMGIAFLWSGADKVLAAEPFDAAGYLQYATPENGSPFADLFVAMGQTDWFVAVVNVAVPWGEVLIGLGLIVGAFTRLAAFFGAFMMLMFYLGNWDMAHGPINGDFAYMLTFLAVAALGAGRVLGLDAYIEQYPVGGRPLVERYPFLSYLLG